MPGTNAGTGYPLTLRCAKCKTGRDWRGFDDAGTNLVATGRYRALLSSQIGHGNPRALYYRAEYRCEDCGHTGWSRHSTMQRLLRAAGFAPPVNKGRGIDWNDPQRGELLERYSSASSRTAGILTGERVRR
jgi:hypothetical protein